MLSLALTDPDQLAPTSAPLAWMLTACEVKTNLPAVTLPILRSMMVSLVILRNTTGFVGKSRVIDCNSEICICHIGVMQMSQNEFCLSTRQAVSPTEGNGELNTTSIRNGSPIIKGKRQWNGHRLEKNLAQHHPNG